MPAKLRISPNFIEFHGQMNILGGILRLFGLFTHSEDNFYHIAVVQADNNAVN